MELLKSADAVSALNQNIQKQLTQMHGLIPHLAIIRIGDRPDDCSYERSAKKRMEAIGIRCSSFVFQSDISNEDFLAEFTRINADPDIDGILLLRPLPAHIHETYLEHLIDPAKDIDGISPVNLAKVFAGDEDGFAPCTPKAVMELLHFAGIEVSGKRICVIGRSLVVGRPLSMLLMKENGTVTICHTKTRDLAETCRQAEILIACAGQAKMIDKTFVGDRAVVIDVGIHVDADGKLCGDVDLHSLMDTNALVTPVPGGVGTMTTSVLAKQVTHAAKKRRGTLFLQ